MRSLFIAIGNPLRHDDGVAREVLAKLEGVESRTVLQLTPEMAENLVGYDIVCFVDAHTGNIPQEVNFVELQGVYQASPFTHHLTPQTCLALAQALYGHSPKGYLMSVRGYKFGFSSELSDQTQQLALAAGQQLISWLTQVED